MTNSVIYSLFLLLIFVSCRSSDVSSRPQQAIIINTPERANLIKVLTLEDGLCGGEQLLEMGGSKEEGTKSYVESIYTSQSNNYERKYCQEISAEDAAKGFACKIRSRHKIFNESDRYILNIEGWDGCIFTRPCYFPKSLERYYDTELKKKEFCQGQWSLEDNEAFPSNWSKFATEPLEGDLVTKQGWETCTQKYGNVGVGVGNIRKYNETEINTKLHDSLISYTILNQRYEGEEPGGAAQPISYKGWNGKNCQFTLVSSSTAHFEKIGFCENVVEYIQAAGNNTVAENPLVVIKVHKDNETGKLKHQISSMAKEVDAYRRVNINGFCEN